jgi:hypothetical protein
MNNLPAFLAQRVIAFDPQLDQTLRKRFNLDKGWFWSYAKRDRDGLLKVCYEQHNGYMRCHIDLPEGQPVAELY